MMRSMFSAVSGLRSHQASMDVIGNNVANVNTVGFKSSRVTFQDMLYETIKAGSAPEGAMGGTNPQQIGLGAMVRTIDTLHTQSSLESTGKLTDLAIQGDGYFALTDGVSTVFTRAGAFDINTQKDLVDPGTGLKVLGWMAGNNAADPLSIDPTLPPTAINIPVGELVIGKQTDNIEFAGNIDFDPAIGDVTMITVQVYDALASPHRLEFSFEKDLLVENRWVWQAEHTDYGSVGDGWIQFNPNGTFHSQDGEVVLNHTHGAATPQTVEPDFSALTQYSAERSDLIVRHQDGFPVGLLETFTIGPDGLITGVFSNGMNRELARASLAVFGNPAGLNSIGNTYFSQSTSSGVVRYVAPGEAAGGTISSGTLEMSNVDLAREFTNMITTQRGFQANSRIITTTDEMLSELVNLKR